MEILKTVIAVVVAQDKIESQKGTLTFKFVDLYGKIVKTGDTTYQRRDLRRTL